MLSELTRADLLAIMQSYGMQPHRIAREDSNEYGYWLFTGEVDEEGNKIRVFQEWTPMQKLMIEQHKEKFDEWFSE